MKYSNIGPILSRVDIDLALSLANAAVGELPAPRITFSMIRLCRQLARIARMDGTRVNLAPIYATALLQDRKSFLALFHPLFAKAESVVNEQS